MARLTRKTFVGDYGMLANPQTKEDLQKELWRIINRLGELEDEIESRENEELSPLPFEE